MLTNEKRYKIKVQNNIVLNPKDGYCSVNNSGETICFIRKIDKFDKLLWIFRKVKQGK